MDTGSAASSDVFRFMLSNPFLVLYFLLSWSAVLIQLLCLNLMKGVVSYLYEVRTLITKMMDKFSYVCSYC